MLNVVAIEKLRICLAKVCLYKKKLKLETNISDLKSLQKMIISWLLLIIRGCYRLFRGCIKIVSRLL